MLGQPMSMLIPQVLGLKLTGELPAGTTATDLVLTVAELLRRTGVVGKFVDFYGPGVANVPLANRATIGNMSPEYGATCAIFPIDDITLDYLRLTGRPDTQVRLVEAYAKEQGLWHDPDHEPTFSQTIELDLGTVEPSIAGPKRPQDRIPLRVAPRRSPDCCRVRPTPRQWSWVWTRRPRSRFPPAIRSRSAATTRATARTRRRPTATAPTGHATRSRSAWTGTGSASTTGTW